MKDTILVPTDFSEVCNNAFNHACDLAKNLGVKVVALHVITKETKNYLDDQHLDNKGLEKRLSDYVNGKKAEFEVETEYVLKEGSIFDEIANVSKELNSVFIVLGTHGKVGFQRLTGSYALKVINSTKIPSIIVQKKPIKASSYKNIVFPVKSFSENLQKVRYAIDIAKNFDATIHLVPKYDNDKYAKSKLLGDINHIQQMLTEENVDYCKTLPDEGAGNFSKQVIDYAVTNDADLIVIITSSNSALPMFDSADEQIIFNTSQIPVMCVNPARVKKIASFGGNWPGM
ncbi:MAG: universal stress protein [Bacteroidales bacterium]|nr:universal stress protein [Bacteroidales bacterium]